LPESISPEQRWTQVLPANPAAPSHADRESLQRPRTGPSSPFQPEISSFALYLAAEGKPVRTIRTYTEAAAWFAAAHLRERTGRSRWEDVEKQDVQRWMVWLLPY